MALKALLILLPLAAAKSGPVLLKEAGTDGMNINVFQGADRAVEAAQKFSAARVVQRDAAAVPARQGSLLNPLRGNVLPDASKTTLLKVKRQEAMTVFVTNRITEAAEQQPQTQAPNVVTKTILEIVKQQPTANANANANNNNNNNNGNSNSNSGGKKGGDQQAAKETVTKTVLANAPQETGNNNNNNNNNNNQQGSSSQNAQASTSANNNAEPSASRSPAAKQSGNNAEKSSNGNNAQASKTAANLSKSTGGVIVPLSAVVPQDEASMERIMGTNFALGGFTYKQRVRKIRRSMSQHWWES